MATVCHMEVGGELLPSRLCLTGETALRIGVAVRAAGTTEALGDEGVVLPPSVRRTGENALRVGEAIVDAASSEGLGVATSTGTPTGTPGDATALTPFKQLGAPQAPGQLLEPSSGVILAVLGVVLDLGEWC